MSNSIPVIKFLFRAEFKVFYDALNIEPHYEVEDVSSANDLATYLSTVSAGLVFASIKDKNDLIQLATFLKISKKVAKQTIIKLVVVNFSGDKTYEKAVEKLGILDFIEPAINTKSLKFKLDYWMKSLNVQVRNNANASAQKTNKAEANKSFDKKASDNQAMTWLEPLDLENDIWILKNDGDCKKVLSKWLIRLMGPSPAVGQWVEVKASIWRFDFKDTQKELFVFGEGAWFFQGDQRPEFIWKENSWLITGKTFDLFYRDQKQNVSRLNSKERKLTICKNSMFAKTKQSIIEESFDRELVFKREAENLNDLQGKNKTEKLDSGPLSGKNKGSETIDGNLSGKTKGEDAIKRDNHVQKTETEKSSTNWSGKNSANPILDDNFDGPKADGFKDGPNLELERKDLEFQKYYKNHNEHQQYQALEAKERQAREEEQKSSGQGHLSMGHLSGRSATDNIEKNYDDSKAEREKKESSAKDGDLYGKSDTDKLKSHYGQKDKAESQTKEKEARDLHGQSSTDKLASHYGNPKVAKSPVAEREEKREKEIKAKELATKDKVEREKVETKERDKKESEDREITERTKAAIEKMQKREGQRREKEEDINKERSGTSLNITTKTEQKTNEVISTEKEKNKLSNQMEKEQRVTRRSDEKNEVYRPVVERADGNNNVLPLSKNRDEEILRAGEEKELDELTRDTKVICNLTQGSRTITCTLDDFFEETIIFKTEEIGIKESQSASLDIVFKFLEKDTKLVIKGDVSAVFDAGDGTNFITVNVSNDSVNSFKIFTRLYETRQANVNEFIKKVKGL